MVLFLRLLLDRARLSFIYRGTFECSDPRWSRNVCWLESRLGIRRPVRILMTNALPVPITWGLFRPVILFPVEALDWPEDRLRSALLHEGAHVRRWDYAVNLVAQFARTLHWFNPIAWHAIRQLGIESERACDDHVLSASTVTPAEYAGHLIDVTYELRTVDLHPFVTASPMACRSELRTRVESLLDDALPRHPSRGTVCFTGLLILLALSPLVMLRLSHKADGREPNKSAATHPVISFEAAISHLQSTTPNRRKKAVWILGEREDPRAVPVLIKNLGDGDPEVRALAAWALGEIKDAASLPALEQSLNDTDRYVREMVVRALGEVEDDRATRPLIGMLDDPDPDVGTAAAWALGEIGGAEALDALMSRFPTGSPSQRIQTIEVLGRKRYAAALPGLIAALGTDPSAEVRGTVARALAAMQGPEIAAALRNALEDSHPTVREAAARSLGRHGDDRAVERLVRCLRDHDPEVRAAAVWALDEIGQ